MMGNPRLAKFAALVVVLSMIAAAFTLVPSHSRAGDTPNEWFEAIPGAPAGSNFNDVQWTPDGKWALWVGGMGGSAAAWWYELSTNTWIEAICMAGAECTYYSTAVWIPSHPSYNDCFMVLGPAGANGAYYFTSFNTMALMVKVADPTIIGFIPQKAIYNPYTAYSENVTAVGSISAMGAYCFEYNTGNEDWGGAGPRCSYTSQPFAVWYDVAVDGSEAPLGDLYLAGRNGAGLALFQVYDMSTKSLVALGYPSGISQFNTIELDDSAAPPYMVVGIGTSGHDNVLYKVEKTVHYNLFIPIPVQNPSMTSIYALDFDSNGVGVMIGEWSYEGDDYGLIMDIWRDGNDYTVVRRSDTDVAGLFYYTYYTDVAMIPMGNPVALVTGSAFKYYYNAASSNIQVDTMFPHIDYVDLYDAGTTTSRVNSQIDVDPGDDSTWYDLTVRAWHNSGKASITVVDAYMWYDQGGVETMPGGFDMAGGENTRIHLRWTRGAPDTWEMIFPWTGWDETTIDVGGCSRTDDAGSDNITLRFRFSPHQQLRYAGGLGFSEPPGVRFGGGLPEDQSTMSALNDMLSWNINVTVRDVGGAAASAYDEFGFFMFTYIGTAGLPGGGNVFGAGPPNTLIALGPTDDVIYSANCPYQLVASVTDLTGQIYSGTIPAGNMGIQGGQIGGVTYFSGPGIPVYLWGSGVPMYQAPRVSYRFTTTQSPGGLQVTWYCDIPSVVEDYYRGTITYSIWHG